eukprot:gene20394-22407_t
MFRSKLTIAGIILIIWALVFCIPYLLPARKSIYSDNNEKREADTSRQKVGVEELLKKSDEDKEAYEVQKKKEEEIAKEEKLSPATQEPDNDMHGDGVGIKEEIEEEDIKNDEPKHKGEIRQGEMCLDTMEHLQGGKAGLYKCHGLGRNQYWVVTKKNLLKNNAVCIEAPAKLDGFNYVTLEECRSNIKQQHWEYENESFILSGKKLCLDSKDGEGLSARQCDLESKTQKWKM